MADLFDNSLIQSPPGATNRREQDSSASLSPLAVSETFPGGLSIKKDAEMESWIKLHRKFESWEWYDDPKTKSVFIHLLLKSNWIDEPWKGILIKRGQCVTGRKKLSIALGISEQSIRTCLDKLKSTNEITIESTNDYSIITICNYDKYQSLEKTPNQRINQPKRRRVTTLKEYKEDKENTIKEKSWRDDFETYRHECSVAFGLLREDREFLAHLRYLYEDADIVKSIDLSFTTFWGTERGWENKKKTKTKTIDWKATISGTIKHNLIKL